MHSSLGIDYGTNSVCALIVDCSNGAELGNSVVDYPSGHQGVLLVTTIMMKNLISIKHGWGRLKIGVSV